MNKSIDYKLILKPLVIFNFEINFKFLKKVYKFIIKTFLELFKFFLDLFRSFKKKYQVHTKSLI